MFPPLLTSFEAIESGLLQVCIAGLEAPVALVSNIYSNLFVTGKDRCPIEVVLLLIDC